MNAQVRGREDRYWEHTFDPTSRRRRRTRTTPPHRDLHPTAAPDGHRCARGQWCEDAEITLTPDGGTTALAAECPRTFCEADQTAIGEKLADIPARWTDLGDELGEAGTDSAARFAAFGPQLPIRADVDALMRRITTELPAWEARVRAVAGLNPPDTTLDRMTPAAVKGTCTTLYRNLDVLLSLQPYEMYRTIPLVAAQKDPTFADCRIIRAGPDYLTIGQAVGGETAGLDILRLHHQAERILGLVRAAPEKLIGVPCPKCTQRRLVRADPPARDTDPAWHARCAHCRHLLSFGAYTDIVKETASALGGPRVTRTPRLAATKIV